LQYTENNARIQMKKVVAFMFEHLFINTAIKSIFNVVFKNNYIRVINYHDTPEKNLKNFEKQLRYFSREFTSVTFLDLLKFFEDKKWHKNKPGLIISFDDGLRTNYDYAYPLLEKYDFCGWFFIPTDFVSTKQEKQKSFMKENDIILRCWYPDGRYAMNWNEIKEISERHIIGCHTSTHHRMSDDDTHEILEREIVTAKKKIEIEIGKEIKCFCWVGGEIESYSKKAFDTIAEAGYVFSFMSNKYPVLPECEPLKIQRTNIESDFPIYLLKFKLSGILDCLSIKERRQIDTKVQLGNYLS